MRLLITMQVMLDKKYTVKGEPNSFSDIQDVKAISLDLDADGMDREEVNLSISSIASEVGYWMARQYDLFKKVKKIPSTSRSKRTRKNINRPLGML